MRELRVSDTLAPVCYTTPLYTAAIHDGPMAARRGSPVLEMPAGRVSIGARFHALGQFGASSPWEGA